MQLIFLSLACFLLSNTLKVVQECTTVASCDPSEIMDGLVESHSLLTHQYLKRFSRMDYVDEESVIREFATEHYVYSRNFQVYLENVLQKIDSRQGMHLIGENLEEERGHYEQDDLQFLNESGVNPDWFKEISHPVLMKRFVEESNADVEFNSGAARKFTDIMINETYNGDACVGLAIMTFAIESTVSKLYQYIWDGLKRSSMNPWAYVFFPLHILIDDGHADALKEAWLIEYAKSPQECLDKSYEAVSTILDARVDWYDSMDAKHEWKGATKASEIAAAKAKTMQMLDPGYSLHQKLALTARILAWEGQGNTLSGQITCRTELKNGKLGIWVPKYGLGIEELIPSDFILVDEDLKPVDPTETGFPNYATRFHVHVYRKRPDINCIVHSHPLHVSALAMTGRKLEPEHMDFMAFYEEVQHLEEWPGVPFGDMEGELISSLLGEKYWSGLLANHGLIVAGKTIEEACYRAYFFERAAKAQLLAMGAALGGNLKKVQRPLGNQARDWRISEGPVQAHFRYWSRMVFKADSHAEAEIFGVATQ